MVEFTCEQYSDEWLRLRRGVPTASEFGRIITPKKCELAAAHDLYISSLIGDMFDAEYPNKDEYATAAMKRGTLMEPEARRYYEYHTGRKVRQVGFCTTDDNRFGCSPDSLINGDGLLELKNPSAAQHVAWTRAGTLPDDYRAQVHGQLIVTGREWADFMSYRPGFEPFIVRVSPDSFTDKLRVCLEVFWVNFQTALSQFQPQEFSNAA